MKRKRLFLCISKNVWIQIFAFCDLQTLLQGIACASKEWSLLLNTTLHCNNADATICDLLWMMLVQRDFGKYLSKQHDEQVIAKYHANQHVLRTPPVPGTFTRSAKSTTTNATIRTYYQKPASCKMEYIGLYKKWVPVKQNKELALQKMAQLICHILQEYQNPKQQQLAYHTCKHSKLHILNSVVPADLIRFVKQHAVRCATCLVEATIWEYHPQHPVGTKFFPFEASEIRLPYQHQ